MSSTNTRTVKPKIYTAEGGPAKRISPEQQLRRLVLSCFLWEDTFYSDGTTVAERISDLCQKVSPQIVADLALEARGRMNLRHTPLLLLCGLLQSNCGKLAGDTVSAVIQRPDELSELLSIYWRDGKRPLAKQLKRGLAAAFQKFDAFSLAKYDRPKDIRLRDVLFLCHAKPKNRVQERTFKQLASGSLPTPDTWETELSAGKDKLHTWTRLLEERKLEALALLRNLRNMEEVRVPHALIRSALKTADISRVLPFRFLVAARYAPHLEADLEERMLESCRFIPRLPGKTLLLIDVSGSMTNPLSAKSDMNRSDAASGLAIILREVCVELRTFFFREWIKEVPARRGMALADLVRQNLGGGTALGSALAALRQSFPDADRLICITDEQTADSLPAQLWPLNYMLNVGAEKNGVGYGSIWTHIDGFSENAVRYLAESEAEKTAQAAEEAPMLSVEDDVALAESKYPAKEDR